MAAPRIAWPEMTESPAPGPPAPLPDIPGALRHPDAPQTGWERVRELFHVNEFEEVSVEADYMMKSALTAAIVGFTYGGVPAARYSRQQYIKHSQAEVYEYRIEAVRSAHNAAIRGLIRYGMRWSWRLVAFVTIFNGVHTVLSAYRDKVVMSHFVAAGAVTGGLFRLNMGMRGLVGGSVVGAMLGLPFGALTSAVQLMMGEDLREQRRRERRRLYEEKLKEWTERLQITDVVMEEMENVEQKSAEIDIERIDQLLQQPRSTQPPTEQ